MTPSALRNRVVVVVEELVGRKLTYEELSKLFRPIIELEDQYYNQGYADGQGDKL